MHVLVTFLLLGYYAGQLQLTGGEIVVSGYDWLPAKKITNMIEGHSRNKAVYIMQVMKRRQRRKKPERDIYLSVTWPQ